MTSASMAMNIPPFVRSTGDLILAVVADRLVAIDDEVPVEPVGRGEVVAIGRRHLPRGLVEGYAAEAGARRREGDGLDRLVGGEVVRVDREQGGPGRGVDLVGPLDAARHAHRR